MLIQRTVLKNQINEHLTFGISSKELLSQYSETVKCSTECKTLKCLAVDASQVYSLYEIIYILERPRFLSFRNDSHGRSLAHSFNSCQSKPDFTFLINSELHTALIDIRSKSEYSQRAAFVHQFRDFCNLVFSTAHDSCHELGRIVSFKICRLISHPRIACSMTLVEGVRCELLPVSPYLLQYLWVMTVSHATLYEHWLHLIDNLFLFLTHCLSQSIALTSCEVSKLSRK